MLGAITLGVFAVLFLRLWALQVLSGTQYLQRGAEQPAAHRSALEAPRGPILDRNGRSSSATPPATAVQLWPADLPEEGPLPGAPAPRRRSLDVPVREMRARDRRSATNDPLTPVIVKRERPRRRRGHLPQRAPGRVPGRPASPTATCATTRTGRSPRTCSATWARSRRAAAEGERARAAPARRRGRPGRSRVGVRPLPARHARRRPAPRRLARPPARDVVAAQLPQPGNAVRLTIDSDSSRRPSARCATASRSRTTNDDWYANGGAIVALDPRDGAGARARVEPDLRPGGLRRPRRRRRPRAAAERHAAATKQLPGARPRDRRASIRRARRSSR